MQERVLMWVAWRLIGRLLDKVGVSVLLPDKNSFYLLTLNSYKISDRS